MNSAGNLQVTALWTDGAGSSQSTPWYRWRAVNRNQTEWFYRNLRWSSWCLCWVLTYCKAPIRTYSCDWPWVWLHARSSAIFVSMQETLQGLLAFTAPTVHSGCGLQLQVSECGRYKIWGVFSVWIWTSSTSAQTAGTRLFLFCLPFCKSRDCPKHFCASMITKSRLFARENSSSTAPSSRWISAAIVSWESQCFFQAKLKNSFLYIWSSLVISLVFALKLLTCSFHTYTCLMICEKFVSVERKKIDVVFVYFYAGVSFIA